MTTLTCSGTRSSEGIYRVRDEHGVHVGVVFPHLQSQAPSWGFILGDRPTSAAEGRTYSSRKRALEAMRTELESRPAARLESIRASLRAESVSYGELAELQGLAAFIPAGDLELREAAGLPEHSSSWLADVAYPGMRVAWADGAQGTVQSVRADGMALVTWDDDGRTSAVSDQDVSAVAP